MFEEKRELSNVALNILQKRYFKDDETTWEQLVDRVVNHVYKDKTGYSIARELILNRYFLPNSPCLVNSGKNNHAGLLACYVVDFPDTIEGIYKTKLDFALVARKGGGCGTTLSKLRPEGSRVNGSTHGYAGGPLKFADTISHDMDAITQAGFRSMAILMDMSVYHPDIKKFILAKTEEGKISNANISVLVDNAFMEKVERGEKYTTNFNGADYEELDAREIFNMIVEGAWRNGEPGIIFYEKINNSPYKITGQEIVTCNPCAEQGLPFNGCCNLGSLDLSKFLDDSNILDLKLLEIAVRLGVNFLDTVIDVTEYPTDEIRQWSYNNRPIGLGRL